ncbi:MAG: hypothetical protein KKF30_16775 [Proteobacteria bacterium]|nr:hypothetical protein [Pseudomonadota bacterium]MBU4469592.1 hypothetical protein [Pseudomonadota bacterium]MCG2753270.1 hypothetical protein [Desulfobacteraceae bacterium]
MVKKMDKFKPVAGKNMLIFLSGFVWVAVGTMLLSFSYTWLNASKESGTFLFVGLGLSAALVIHHFGFLKIVDKNLGRISLMEGGKCLFSFMAWKSYLIVAIMATMGVLLRHSSIPKPYLSVLYIGIGLSLILSSIRYLRVLLSEFKKTG